MIVNGMPKGTLKAFQRYNLTIFVGGHLAPSALLAMGYALPYPTGLYAVILGALLALLGGWLMKYVLITKAAFNQGFQLPHEPVRGSGKPGPSAKPGWTAPSSATTGRTS
jgi:phenylacetyl-CoA:acceptor oxidoreductase subunit 2